MYALTRRPFGKEHPKLANRIVVFERMAEQLKGLTAQDAFCCIGTTIAEAGSQEAFRAVDVDAVLLFARAARAAQATRFVVVSSVGADSQLEEVLPAHQGRDGRGRHRPGFHLGRHPAAQPVVRPAQGAARRSRSPGSIFAPLINPLLTGAREALRAIPAETVARAMLGAARRGARGVYRYTYGGIRQLAEMRAGTTVPAQAAKKRPA